jgi:hypothetical protein
VVADHNQIWNPAETWRSRVRYCIIAARLKPLGRMFLDAEIMRWNRISLDRSLELVDPFEAHPLNGVL